MKRRRLLQSIAVTPAVAAAQYTPRRREESSEASAAVTASSGDASSTGIARFFTPAQMAALAKLADALVPGAAGRPSARDCGAPEFLDFLISQSPQPTQQLYRNGLDRLSRDGVNATTLAPLAKPWTNNPPAGAFERFLWQAKQDLLQATVNSREWADAAPGVRRGSGGMNNYWRNVD